MAAFNFVRASFYRDSVTLMRLAGAMEAVAGVTRAAAMMGTPANRALLEQAGLLAKDGAAAGPADLVIAVVAEDAAAAEAALAAAEHALLARPPAVRGAEATPRTLEGALRALPGANPVLISAPGADAATEVACVIGKPPGRATALRLAEAVGALGKPCVVNFTGETLARAPWHAAATLEDAARAAVALARGDTPAGVEFTRPAPEIERLVAEAVHGLAPGAHAVRGMYAGGTLAWEARGLLAARLRDVAPGVTGGGGLHRVVDLGEDAFTVGRPHPMIDGRVRREWIDKEGRDPGTAVLLLDVVLGYGAHPDPAGELLPALDAARARGLAVIAGVCGTDADPQPRAAQVARLRDAGVLVMDSNAQAARLATLIALRAGAPAAP